MQEDIHYISVRNIRIGEGVPKICVPVVARSIKALPEVIDTVMESDPDIIEFRADYIINSNMDDGESMDAEMLKAIRKRIDDKVLLFTIRTVDEGGEADITADEYIRLCKTACDSGCIDLVDVEAFKQDGILGRISEIAHKNNVYVVGSNHNFEKTPEEEDILRRLIYMGENGADMPKIAVMPNSPEDVVRLLSATLRYRGLEESKPVITMSMGWHGVISRLSGEIFGSAVTFAAVGETSAPGQIPIEDVRYILNVLHQNQSCRRNS